MKRGYSWLNIREVDDDKRIIEGIATTPQQARDGDILETAGIQFKLPLPFLYQHNSRQPIGNVMTAKVDKDGIRVRIQIAPPGTADFIDEAWRLIRAGLVRGLSIGWRTLQELYDKEIGGFRILKSEWLELSAVSVPADPNATITSLRSADEALLAALGKEMRPVRERTIINRPGVSGKRGSYDMKSSFATQIETLESERDELTTRMASMVEQAAGPITEETQRAELETMKARAREIDQQVDDLAVIENRSRTARPVAAPAVVPVQDPKPRPVVQKVEKVALPPGIGMARAVIALVRANGNHLHAAELARQHWKDTPEVGIMLRAVVEAGDTTTSGWASQLVPAAQQLQSEFLELLRQATIINRLPLKTVPFNIAIPIETASGTAQWVGEGAPKPVTKLTLSSVTLTWAKAAAIVVITKELAKFSSPAAEMVVRNSMVKTLVRFFDTHFVSATAAVANVSPAGILNGISSTATSGTTATAFRVDMNTMLQKFTVNNVPLSGISLIMSSSQAVALSLMVTDLGVPLFPSITREGGSILGFPVVISEAVGTKIIALNTDEILLASDPGVSVDVSDTASVEMDDAPSAGETSPVTTISTLKSFWQNNLVGIRVEQFITWKYARTSAVEYITGNAYVPS